MRLLLLLQDDVAVRWCGLSLFVVGCTWLLVLFGDRCDCALFVVCCLIGVVACCLLWVVCCVVRVFCGLFLIAVDVVC